MNSISDSWRRLKIRAGGAGNSEDVEESPADIAHVLGAINLKNFSTLKDVAEDSLTKKPIDDRTYLMERIVQLASELPTNSVSGQSITNAFLAQLWGDLQHPPKSYLGAEYAYRKADGSRNNFLWPHIGAAGQPYARSVKAITQQPVARPDPDVIFDSLLRRKQFKPHPNKISSALFYVASVIIHDLFHTNHEDPAISDTSSYLDLAPLYGSSEEAQDSVRTHQDGKLKPDCFADPRVLGFPPGVGVLLVMFNRFHNTVAENLAQIDENGRYSRILNQPGRSTPKDAHKKYDEALFQTARLVTTGLYVNIILKDYVRTILNLNRVDSNWDLDPRAEAGKAVFGQNVPEATGNQVSAEFNLIYRWHSCVSEEDERWTQAAYHKIFPGTSTDSTMSEFLSGLQTWANSLPSEPQLRPFADLKRTDTGHFLDDDIASIWTASVNSVAGAFGTGNVPEVLRKVEVLGMIQARMWNLASLNEFRKYFKLRPWTSFEDMNPDKRIAENLRRLYEHIDNVELYPGVILEAAKESQTPGSGLCTNFTISRAILSDAVALVRGDRFYTVDYSTSNLTNYGYAMADYDLSIDYGCVFYKLVLNALPHNYVKDSIYAHYPLVIPSENAKILANLGQESFYDFSLPTKLVSATTVRSFAACEHVIQTAMKSATIGVDSLTYQVASGKAQTETNSATVVALRQYLAVTPNATYVQQYFERVTSSLLRQNAYRLIDMNQVDIIRDVSNIAQVHFAACLFGLPLKTIENPNGAYEATDLWAAMIAIHSSVHPRQSATDSFKAQQMALPAIKQLAKLIEDNIRSAMVGKGGVFASIVDILHDRHSSDLTDQSMHLFQSMLRTGATPAQLVYSYILPVAATIIVSQARAFADCLNYFLGRGSEHLDQISHLAHLDTQEADVQLEHYVLEALRICSNLRTYVYTSHELAIADGKEDLKIPMGGLIKCDLAAANRDHRVYKNSDHFDAERCLSTYLPGVTGFPPACPGLHLGRPAMVGLLKSVCRLPNLRRAIGPIGHMKMMRAGDGGDLYLTTSENEGRIYPSSMKVNFD